MSLQTTFHRRNKGLSVLFVKTGRGERQVYTAHDAAALDTRRDSGGHRSCRGGGLGGARSSRPSPRRRSRAAARRRSPRVSTGGSCRPRQAPIRWTTDRATFRLPAPADRAGARRDRAGRPSRDRGRVVGAAWSWDAIAGRVSTAAVPLARDGRRRATSELALTPFVAGDGRTLGAQLLRVAVSPRERGWPGRGCCSSSSLPALAAVGGGRAAGLPPARRARRRRGTARAPGRRVLAQRRRPFAVRGPPTPGCRLSLAVAVASAAFAEGCGTGWAFVALVAACARPGLAGDVAR